MSNQLDVQDYSGHESAVYALAAFEEGFLSGGGDGYVVQWTPQSSNDGRLIAKVDDSIFCLLPFGKTLAIGTLSGDLYWVELEKDEKPKRWKFHEDGLFGLLSLDDRVYAIGGKGRLSEWSTQSGEMIRYAQLDQVRLRSICYIKGLKLFAVGTANGDIHFVDPSTLRIAHTIPLAHEMTVFSLVVGESCNTLYSAGRDGKIRWWSLTALFQQIGQMNAHDATVNQLIFDASERLWSAGRDRQIRIWEVSESKLVLAKALRASRDNGHVASVNCLLHSAVGVVSAGDDRIVKIWS